jgi:UbiA prenyltransferase family
MSQVNELSERATLLDYLRLFRTPNVFTAIADVSMGFLFVHTQLAPVPILACLLAASCLLYTAGMVLNDVYDAEVDALQRPERPIPAGHISRRRARVLGFGFLLVGVAAGWLAGYVQPVGHALAWRSGVIATALAVCVVLYDAALKDTLLGPVLLGSCRLLNVLLGMSLGAPLAEGWSLLGYGGPQWLVAAGIGVYVAGITWFSRQEAEVSSRLRLTLALLTMMAGIGLLGLLHRSLPERDFRGLQSEGYWLLLLGLLGFTILRRCGMAIAEPTSEQVQTAVKHGLQSLIMLDAAVTVEVNSQYYYALGMIALLLIPSAILGRWVYST